MIINSHVHVNTDNNYFFYNDYNLSKLLREMSENKIDIALITLNPKLNLFRCPNDCSMNCPVISNQPKRNDNLNTCNCTNPNRHRVKISEEDDMLLIKCSTCVGQ